MMIVLIRHSHRLMINLCELFIVIKCLICFSFRQCTAITASFQFHNIYKQTHCVQDLAIQAPSSSQSKTSNKPHSTRNLKNHRWLEDEVIALLAWCNTKTGQNGKYISKDFVKIAKILERSARDCYMKHWYIKKHDCLNHVITYEE